MEPDMRWFRAFGSLGSGLGPDSRCFSMQGEFTRQQFLFDSFLGSSLGDTATECSRFFFAFLMLGGGVDICGGLSGI